VIGKLTTSAAKHLHEVNINNPGWLTDGDGQHFHTMVAKLPFVSKRARPDMQEAVAFLTTQVKTPDTDDYKKLGKVLKYLRGTPHRH